MNRTIGKGSLLAACLLAATVSPLSSQVDRGRGVVVGGGVESGRSVQRASCVLQLDVDPNRGRSIDTQTLNALLTSTALVDPAAEKALGLSSEAWPKVAQVELVPAGNLAVRLGVSVSQSAEAKLPANAAKAFLDELAARAKAAVEEVGARQEESNAKRMAELEKDQAAARERLEKVQAQMQELRALDGGNDFANARRAQASDRQSLELNIAAQKARLGVIQEELERLRGAASSRPVASPWAEVVAAREKLVASLRANLEKFSKTEADVLQAEADLAEARALAASASRVEPRGGYDISERWQSEAVTLRANIAESEVRLASIVERMPKSSTTQPASPLDMERLRQEEQSARQTLMDVTNQLEQLRREKRSGGAGVRLLILDGKPRS